MEMHMLRITHEPFPTSDVTNASYLFLLHTK